MVTNGTRSHPGYVSHTNSRINFPARLCRVFFALQVFKSMTFPTLVTLAWRDVSLYVVKNRCKIKRIINNSTGAITSGSLVALMGASGSGKTTLMSALAYRTTRKFDMKMNRLLSDTDDEVCNHPNNESLCDVFL